MSSIVCSTCTPSAVDRPTAGSASMARMRLPGKASTSSRTIAEHREVLPTPPFPATAMILAFVLFSSIVRSLLTAEKICGSCGSYCIHPTTGQANFSVSRSQTGPQHRPELLDTCAVFFDFSTVFSPMANVSAKLHKKELRNLLCISIMFSATLRQVFCRKFHESKFTFLQRSC